MKYCYVVIGRYHCVENGVDQIHKRIVGVFMYYTVACEVRDYLNNTQTKYDCIVSENEIYDSLSEFQYFND